MLEIRFHFIFCRRKSRVNIESGRSLRNRSIEILRQLPFRNLETFFGPIFTYEYNLHLITRRREVFVFK